MKKIIFGAAAIVAVVSICFIASGSGPVITDEMIRATLGESRQVVGAHDVMAKESRRLNEILDGFLSGDMEKIDEKAGQIVESMQAIAQEFPIETQAQPAAWKAMSEIVNQASSLRSAAQSKDYKKAYNHYALLVNQCVQCHQSTREWGKFSDVEKKDKKDKKEPVVLEDQNEKEAAAENETV